MIDKQRLYNRMVRMVEAPSISGTPEEMTAQVFAPYNRENPAHAMTAFDNVAYCLAVRRRI